MLPWTHFWLIHELFSQSPWASPPGSTCHLAAVCHFCALLCLTCPCWFIFQNAGFLPLPCTYACVLSRVQLFCNPMDCSPPGSSVYGILQARTLAWVVIPFSRGSSQPRDWTRVSSSPALAVEFFTIEPAGNSLPLPCQCIVFCYFSSFVEKGMAAHFSILA